MNASDPRAEVHRRILETDRTEVHTWLPARVRSYNDGAQTAEIEIGVREVLPSGDDDTPDTVQDFPILVDVPVMHLRGGGYFLHVPLEAGDTGIVMFAETDIGAWRASSDGAPTDPGTGVRHGMAGAIFVPGLHLYGAGLSGGDRGDGITLGREGGPAVKVRTSTIEAGGNAALALGADVKAHLQAIAAALNTIAAAAMSTNSYVYATVLGTNPINTSVLKGS